MTHPQAQLVFAVVPHMSVLTCINDFKKQSLTYFASMVLGIYHVIIKRDVLKTSGTCVLRTDASTLHGIPLV